MLLGGAEAKDACGVDQLCASLEADIEGGIHVIRLLWEMHAAEEEWGFLLIDAKNAFNEGNRLAMLWTVRHKWPSGARFTFNCYKHWTTLVVCTGNGLALFIFMVFMSFINVHSVCCANLSQVICSNRSVNIIVQILMNNFINNSAADTTGPAAPFRNHNPFRITRDLINNSAQRMPTIAIV